MAPAPPTQSQPSRGKERHAGDPASFSLCWNERETDFTWITHGLSCPFHWGFKPQGKRKKEKRNHNNPVNPGTLNAFPPWKALSAGTCLGRERGPLGLQKHTQNESRTECLLFLLRPLWVSTLEVLGGKGTLSPKSPAGLGKRVRLLSQTQV